ncbi:tudor domain-containing protein [Arthrobacter sp. NPDC058127]|uniref:tudor domain-containing protein n=1 Tax=Arthrobacter sp. NPDC058127 TaxID=3346351 RepID=UPI0036F01700
MGGTPCSRPERTPPVEYLGSHNPFPDETAVEVLRGDGSTWEQAVIVERVGVDEWTVEYEDGEKAWRDHHELRPTAAN